MRASASSAVSSSREHDVPDLGLDEPALLLDQPVDLPEDAPVHAFRAVVGKLAQQLGDHRVGEGHLLAEREQRRVALGLLVGTNEMPRQHDEAERAVLAYVDEVAAGVVG